MMAIRIVCLLFVGINDVAKGGCKFALQFSMIVSFSAPDRLMVLWIF